MPLMGDPDRSWNPGARPARSWEVPGDMPRYDRRPILVRCDYHENCGSAKSFPGDTSDIAVSEILRHHGWRELDAGGWGCPVVDGVGGDRGDRRLLIRVDRLRAGRSYGQLALDDRVQQLVGRGWRIDESDGDRVQLSRPSYWLPVWLTLLLVAVTFGGWVIVGSWLQRSKRRDGIVLTLGPGGLRVIEQRTRGW